MASTLLPTALRWLKRLIYAIFGFTAAVLIVWAFMSRSLPDLELWHTVDLETEFTAGDAGQVRTFEDYRALESRLFKV